MLLTRRASSTAKLSGALSHYYSAKIWFKNRHYHPSEEHECSLEIGYTILELHLHPPSTLGQSETCDGCEPGVRKAAILRQSRLAMPSRDEIRKDAHKNLKKVCGVTTNRFGAKSHLDSVKTIKISSKNNYNRRSEFKRLINFKI